MQTTSSRGYTNLGSTSSLKHFLTTYTHFVWSNVSHWLIISIHSNSFHLCVNYLIWLVFTKFNIGSNSQSFGAYDCIFLILVNHWIHTNWTKWKKNIESYQLEKMKNLCERLVVTMNGSWRWRQLFLWKA